MNTRPCILSGDCIAWYYDRSKENPADEVLAGLVADANQGEFERDETGYSELLICSNSTCSASFLIQHGFGVDDKPVEFLQRRTFEDGTLAE